MKKRGETTPYILAIVAIVAIVGVFSYLTANDGITGLAAKDRSVTCSDTDGGQNTDQKGTVTLSQSSSGWSESYTDSCNGNKIKEYYCKSSSHKNRWGAINNLRGSTDPTCDHGCSNGACNPPPTCQDSDGDGYGENCAGPDCDDTDPNVHPGASEACDEVDNNCNGIIDEGVTSTYYQDSDGDGYGSSSSTQACTQPSGYVTNSDDCNDNEASTYPGAPESCGTVDSNCDGSTETCGPEPQPGPGPEPGDHLAPGDHTFSLKMGMFSTRYYDVHVPPSYQGTAVPVVLAMHGGGGDTSSIKTQAQFSEKADEPDVNFIVVYPKGQALTWNAGACCGSEDKDDVAFISALIDDLAEKTPIDTKRVYATGHSNGALMSYRLACDLSEKIAAIGTNVGHGALAAEDCNPTRKVPVMDFHGKADEIVAYEGGQCGVPSSRKGKWDCTSVENYANEWAERNGCDATPVVSNPTSDIECRTYQNCDAPVIYCASEMGGHTWPGGQYVMDSWIWKNQVGLITPDISATDAFWNFFQLHSLP